MDYRDQHPESDETQRQPATSSDAGVSAVDDQIREVLRLLDDGADQETLALFTSLHPADQARVLQATSPEVRDRLAPLLSATQWAGILEHLDAEEAAQAVQEMDVSSLTEVLDEMRPEVAADVLLHMPGEEAEEALSATVRAEEIVPLMAYSEETAGGLMSPVTVTVSEGATLTQVMGLLRQIEPLLREQTSFFVVDSQHKLLGTVSLQALVFSEPDSLVHDVMMDPVASIGPNVDQEECARLMERYDLAELPVVNDAGRLLGVIFFQQVFDVAEEEATEDMYRLAGLGARESVASSVGRSVLDRLPWLLVNLGTVILAAAVISLFESTIAQLVILAAFLPVVASQGGAAGTQTLTLMVRSIALGEVSFRSNRGMAFRELILSSVNGIILGIVIGAVGLIWEDSVVLGAALFVAMLANMVVAGLAGALIPLGMRAIGLDPALASVVLVTTLTDIAGFAIFLGTATVLLRYL